MVLRVSALVVNFNAGALLLRCVDSLRAAGVRDILVGDNGSTDQSLLGIRGEPSVRIIENHRNLGFGKAVNRLAERATEDYLLIINPDAALASDAIQPLIDALHQNPVAMIAGGRITNPDGSEQRAARRRRPTPLRSMVTAFGLDGRFEGINIRESTDENPSMVFGVSGALLLVRRKDWNRLGGFDEHYFLHCEDLDLFARIADQFHKGCVYVPSAHAVHAHGACHTGVRVRSALHKWRGMRRYYRKHEARNVIPGVRWLWPMALTLRLALQIPAFWWHDRKHGE